MLMDTKSRFFLEKIAPLRVLVFIFLLGALSLQSAEASQIEPLRPPATEKCPVCGMFVAKYTNWTAAVIFKDSRKVYFDGPKDLFAYYLDLKKYDPAKKLGDISACYMKDYYSLALIDAQKAYFVIGSDVYGPMGKELIPFEKPADAKEFLKDHKGKRVLRFKDITLQVLKTLE